MTPIIDSESGSVFVGSVDDVESLAAAAEIARDCDAFSIDDDDECYVEGDEPTCFNCRARRWTGDGFSCTKGLLRV
jgi:hypothetical protein